MSCRQIAIVGVIATTFAGAPRTSAADPIIIDVTIASGRFLVMSSARLEFSARARVSRWGSAVVRLWRAATSPVRWGW
jgi:hypothetical protein